MKVNTWKSLFVFIYKYKKRQAVHKFGDVIDNILDFLISPFWIIYSIFFFTWGFLWLPVEIVICSIVFVVETNSKKREQQQSPEV